MTNNKETCKSHLKLGAAWPRIAPFCLLKGAAGQPYRLSRFFDTLHPPAPMALSLTSALFCSPATLMAVFVGFSDWQTNSIFGTKVTQLLTCSHWPVQIKLRKKATYALFSLRLDVWFPSLLFAHFLKNLTCFSFESPSTRGGQETHRPGGSERWED